MRRDGWIALLGIGLMAPAQIAAEQPGRAELSFRAGNPPTAECRRANRKARVACSSRLAPIRASGRIVPSARNRAWVTVDWGRTLIRRPTRADRFEPMSQHRLKRMLGPALVSRIRAVGHRSGLHGALRGHWFVGPRRGAVLVVSMGGREVAQIADYDRDGHVDAVLVRNALRPSPLFAHR